MQIVFICSSASVTAPSNGDEHTPGDEEVEEEPHSHFHALSVPPKMRLWVYNKRFVCVLSDELVRDMDTKIEERGKKESIKIVSADAFN